MSSDQPPRPPVVDYQMPGHWRSPRNRMNGAVVGAYSCILFTPVAAVVTWTAWQMTLGNERLTALLGFAFLIFIAPALMAAGCVLGRLGLRSLNPTAWSKLGTAVNGGGIISWAVFVVWLIWAMQ